MMSLSERDSLSLNQHLRERAMMLKKMRARWSRKEVKSKESSKEKRKGREGKNLRMIIMPLGRFLMLREPSTSRCWRIVKGR